MFLMLRFHSVGYKHYPKSTEHRARIHYIDYRTQRGRQNKSFKLCFRILPSRQGRNSLRSAQPDPCLASPGIQYGDCQGLSESGAVPWSVRARQPPSGPSSKSNYSLLHAIVYFGKASRLEAENRNYVEKVIDFMELEPYRKKMVGNLSYGVQKRVEVARALTLAAQVAASG